MKKAAVYLVAVLLVAGMFAFSMPQSAQAAGWLSADWYSQYYNNNPQPQPAPEPTPTPQPDPQPQPAPNPQPVSNGWLSPSWYSNYYQNPQPQPTPEPQPSPQPGNNGGSTNVSGLAAQEQHLVDLVNAERTKRGLNPLTVDTELTKLARMKSQDMVDLGYFAHLSPIYGNVGNMLKNYYSKSYRMAGENLAKAVSTDSAFNLFMNSPIHRANILNTNYTHIGIGIVPQASGSGVMVTQIFVQR